MPDNEPGGEVPAIFAIGMATMLLLPLLLALCAAWICSRDAYGSDGRRRGGKARVGELTPNDESDGETDALRPSRTDSWDASPGPQRPPAPRARITVTGGHHLRQGQALTALE